MWLAPKEACPGSGLQWGCGVGRRERGEVAGGWAVLGPAGPQSRAQEGSPSRQVRRSWTGGGFWVLSGAWGGRVQLSSQYPRVTQIPGPPWAKFPPRPLDPWLTRPPLA